ncbi:DEAD/DEAH box helicase [Komagataeibacter nataicola]|uniref:DEAD/DEAH box helicase n=1 Tax=Komagataeibacter nataicola TaxID=265960 RepID=UPI0023DD3F6E|nr:DEAD/DEAH box helicase [Komagataeibacter nataicola]WEQ57149.1 DEAD/DEAH box helicase [Komagataeibacter nataicola]
MNFSFTYSSEAVVLDVLPERRGMLARMFTISSSEPDLENLSEQEHRLVFALGDLRALSDEMDERLEITRSRIIMGHRLIAALDAETAATLGLPPLTDLTLCTDAEGVIGSPDFRLVYYWERGGQRRTPQRTGAILDMAGGQRIPLWMLDALDVADSFVPTRDDARHWEALARFRRALDPGIEMAEENPTARLSMTDFLQGLKISLSDCLSISPNGDGTDFEVVPFSSRRPDTEGMSSEADGELEYSDLGRFQNKFRERGVLKAYSLARGHYLVMDPSVAPVLKVMSEMQRASPQERRAFIRNPRIRITEAVEADLRVRGELTDLSPEEQEEAIEAVAVPAFVETKEYSDRVIGVEVYRGNLIGREGASGTTWLPEAFAPKISALTDDMSVSELRALREKVEAGLIAEENVVSVANGILPVTPQTLAFLDAQLAAREEASGEVAQEGDGEAPKPGPIILKTIENTDNLSWNIPLRPRRSDMGEVVPPGILTRLKDHQVNCLEWQIRAWKAGLPGILNADEQGLGKTLQTISFLVWLNEHMRRVGPRRPILVVAPTSLLKNWEMEVERHVTKPGLGFLVRLYGASISARKLPGQRGTDKETGEEKLDFSDIHNAIERDSGHFTWILTTYATLTNYQHSLARIPFAVTVFDEIQNIKTPGTLSFLAAHTLDTDFRIGLTGTPIENSTRDIWAIMDTLAPGALGSLQDFRERYGAAEQGNMEELYERLFTSFKTRPPLAIRRLKEKVARDLPTKSRFLHPQQMPLLQAQKYEEARVKLQNGGAGAALKMLHHIRSVSVHPALDADLDTEDFIGMSARLSTTFDILRRIRAEGERALVFIEHRRMQHRFIELAKVKLRLKEIGLINSDTPIRKRQEIVDNFQKNIERGNGFDLLVLGPKAAGTGLTLTAATHVIHLSRWWNPAVEEQCNDRVHRLGQTRPVTIHVPLAIHPNYREQSFDLLLQSLMQRKRQLATSALWPMGDSERDVACLTAELQECDISPQGDVIQHSMKRLYERDGLDIPKPDQHGGWSFK